MSHQPILSDISRYYASRLAEHGSTARGVDWKDESSQRQRFTELLGPWADDTTRSVLDYGCGYGALVDTLSDWSWQGPYVGFDLAPEMVTEARRRYSGRDHVAFTDRRTSLRRSDVVVASGIFNVKLGHDVAMWHRYVSETLDDLARLCRVGFSFNCLTAYSDDDRKRPDLYYADPARLLTECATRYSRWVRVTQDYGLYEFTLTVRMEGSWRNS